LHYREPRAKNFVSVQCLRWVSLVVVDYQLYFRAVDAAGVVENFRVKFHGVFDGRAVHGHSAGQRRDDADLYRAALRSESGVASAKYQNKNQSQNLFHS
jgi:hypothetical protein